MAMKSLNNYFIETLDKNLAKQEILVYFLDDSTCTIGLEKSGKSFFFGGRQLDILWKFPHETILGEIR
jgi:hypothetical protein